MGADEIRTIPFPQALQTDNSNKAQCGEKAKEKGGRRRQDTTRRKAVERLRQLRGARNQSLPPNEEEAEEMLAVLAGVLRQGGVKMHDGRERSVKKKVQSFTSDLSSVKLDCRTQAPSSGSSATGGKRRLRPPEPEKKPSKPDEMDQAQSMREDVENIRGYLDLLDEYSLHHFIIWQGRVLEDTPEFSSFQRTYTAVWGPLTQFLRTLEGLMRQNGVPLAIVDGTRLAQLASLDSKQLDDEDIMLCIANLEQIRPHLRHVRVVSQGRKPRTLAALKIQSIVRMRLAWVRCKRRLRERYASILIQSRLRGALARMRAGLLHSQRLTQLEEAFQANQRGLAQEWSAFKRKPRVLIQLPSLSYDEHVRLAVERFDTLQNLQVARMSAVADPDVHVIYISPSPLSEEAMQYHTKLLELAGAQDVARRLSVVVPEGFDVYPRHFSLTHVLLLSPVCVSRISQLVAGRPALLVAGKVSWQEKRLAVRLGVPMLSADEKVTGLCSSHSGQRQICKAADVSTAFGAHDIYSEEDFLIALTKLASSNLAVKRWVFKLDGSSGGTGLAYLDVKELPCMAALRQQRATLLSNNKGQSQVWHHPDVQLLCRAQLLKTLRQYIHKIAVLCDRSVYPSWKSFIQQLERVGAVIEAEPNVVIGRPCISLFIAPDGAIELGSEAECIIGNVYQLIGHSQPQTSVPSPALQGAAQATAVELHNRGVTGHVTLAFTAFWDSKAQAPRLWASEIDLGLSDAACAHMFYALNARMPCDFGSFRMPGVRAAQQLAYVYIRGVCVEGLLAMQPSNFFKMCRIYGVSFDLDTKIGTVFNLGGGLAGGSLGILVIANVVGEALKKATTGLRTLSKIAPTAAKGSAVPVPYGLPPTLNAVVKAQAQGQA